jgi:hypothetical protein
MDVAFEVTPNEGWALVQGTASVDITKQGSAGWNCANRFLPGSRERCVGHATEQLNQAPSRFVYRRAYSSGPIVMRLCAREAREIEADMATGQFFGVWPGETFVVMDGRGTTRIEITDPPSGNVIEAFATGDEGSRARLVTSSGGIHTYLISE